MNRSTHSRKSVTWWGRSDVRYARNGVIRDAMKTLDIQVIDYKPTLSCVGNFEAKLHSIKSTDVIWVPCFRQRDVASAKKWSNTNGIPLVFDPLISAYDKQVYERKKFSPSSSSARRLLQWEQRLFQMADVVIADTWMHAEYFEQTLCVLHNSIHVIPVSAQENLFSPEITDRTSHTSTRYRILYYGNYLALHGVETIVDAIHQNKDTPIDWVLIGDGPMRAMAEDQCSGMNNVRFVNRVNYEDLPNEIHVADLVLGVFGTTAKASRVIPNKVYQTLACGRPVATMRSDAYPSMLLKSEECGIYWVDAGHSEQLTTVINNAMQGDFSKDCQQARRSYDSHFSNKIVEQKLATVMQSIS